MNFENIKRIGIIGAGEAGVGTAKMLLSQGFDCTVFERNNQIGGVWTTGYLDFGIQVQRELYEIPDFPQPIDSPDFTPGPQVRQYLQDYADSFGVTPHVRLSTTVTGVSKPTAGQRSWTIISVDREGREQVEEFDLVVIAIGVYSQSPHLPSFPGEQRFNGHIIHNSELQNEEQLKDKKVVVVGYGKSATDAAVLAAEHAREATILFREAHWPVPAKLLGAIPFKYALFNRFTNCMLPTHVRAAQAVRVWHRFGSPLIWLFWRMVEWLLAFQCGLKRPRRGKSATTADLMPSQPIEFDGFGNSTMLPKPEFLTYIHQGKLGAERTEISSFTERGVVLKNGRSLECDLVVLATGWNTDYGFLARKVFDQFNFEEDGLYLYRQMIHPDVPGLLFVGSNATTYINILTHNLQARWLVELLKGRHMLPSRAEMRSDILATKAWKRKIIPFSKARATTLHLHMQQYHDELLRDMGLSPYLKRGVFWWLREIFLPYQPSDYVDVASGRAFCDEDSARERSHRAREVSGSGSFGLKNISFAVEDTK